jgi:hypothetical protein
MSQKYNIYDILFEFDGATSKKTDLSGRLAALRAAQKSKADQEKSSSPSGKLGVTGGGISQQELVQGSQKELKKNIEAITKVADKVEPSKEEVKKAITAMKAVPAQVQTVSHLLYPEIPEEQPKASKPKEEKPSEPVSPTAKTEPQMPAMATAKTEPQIQTRPATVAKTQEVPQTDMQAIMAASRQRSGVGSGVNTEVLPAAKPGLFQRLKQRVGLEEAVKLAIKEAITEAISKQNRK